MTCKANGQKVGCSSEKVQAFKKRIQYVVSINFLYDINLMGDNDVHKLGLLFQGDTFYVGFITSRLSF